MAVSIDPTEYVRSVLRRAKVEGVISLSDLESILDDKPNMSCDDIEDIVVLLADMGIKIGPTQEQEEQGAAERKKAALHKSKQAAIEKYGAVMVAAAERWGGNRLPPNMSIDPYGSLIACYRATYGTAITRKKAKLPKVIQLRTRRPVPELDLACTVRAIERMHDAPSRPFVGAYLLEACRDAV
jgi:hypothetical protein